MKQYLAVDTLDYNGSQLSSLWAYRQFGLLGDSIVAFRGAARVEVDSLVDLEDVRAGAHIYSPEMLHFIVEHFDLDLDKTILRQRLLIAIIKELIAKYYGVCLKRQGDDLYLGEAKLSVSIATLSPVSSLIHTGLNIRSEGTPVITIGLADLGVEEPRVLAEKIMDAYIEEIAGIRRARCKVRGVT